MSSLKTKYFSTIEFAPETVLDFPRGLPGFDNRRRFVAIQQAETEPMVYLQSVEDPDLCFLSLPVLVIDTAYRMQVSDEDLAELGFEIGRQPKIGADVLCLAVVALRENGPTANLLAPIVVNLNNRKAVQAVAEGPGYSHQQVLITAEAAVC